MREDRTTSEIMTFEKAEFGSIRVKEIDGEPWFVVKDVCGALGLENTTKAMSRLDRDEFTSSKVTDSSGREQESYLVNEPGLYSLVLSSRKPEAKAFKRWVTHEVLPAIRKTGGYMVVKDEETPEETMARALLIAKDALDRKEERIKALEVEGRAKDERIARMSPMAAFAENVLDSDGSCTVTEAARLMKQVDPSMGQRKLFGLLRADSMIEKRSNMATAVAVERGYLYNFVPEPYEDPLTGERKIRKAYARVTPKGVRWMTSRYCRAVVA